MADPNAINEGHDHDHHKATLGPSQNSSFKSLMVPSNLQVSFTTMHSNILTLASRKPSQHKGAPPQLRNTGTQYMRFVTKVNCKAARRVGLLFVHQAQRAVHVQAWSVSNQGHYGVLGDLRGSHHKASNTSHQSTQQRQFRHQVYIVRTTTSHNS